MRWDQTWETPLTAFLSPFHALVGDQRTWTTLTETVKGILAASSLVCHQIAATSAVFGAVKNGAQRILRMAAGTSTTRSTLDAEHLTAVLRTQALQQLADADADELWLIADGSDLRKPYAQAMPHLMPVRDLAGGMVPGYRTLNVLGLTPQRRGILYHHLFSTSTPGFVSEPQEVQRALTTVSQAIAPMKTRMPVSWILDAGFDDIAVWRTIWEQDEQVLVRIAHDNRRVEYRTEWGHWKKGGLEDARDRLQHLATVETTLTVRMPGDRQARMQTVTAELWATPIRLSYDGNVRRAGPKTPRQKHVWLVEVRVPGTTMDPWLLLTDWPVADAEAALRVFRMYRQRWSVEDAFKLTKECVGWEEVQVLDLRSVRTLVALAWVAAGFLYELGVTWEEPSVRLLAKLGGFVEKKGRKPGKITLLRGLRRLMEMMSTDAFLKAYYRDHGPLPPQIAAFIPGWLPPDPE